MLHLIDTENSGDSDDQATSLRLPSPVRSFTGHPGRPAYDIPWSQLEALIERGFSYAAIARMLNVSPRTLRRRRAEFGLPAGRLYSEISDHHLDQLVSEILQVCVCARACTHTGAFCRLINEGSYYPRLLQLLGFKWSLVLFGDEVLLCSVGGC